MSAVFKEWAWDWLVVYADGAHRLYGDISAGKVNSWRSFPFYQNKLVLNIIVRFEGLCLGDSLIPFKR